MNTKYSEINSNLFVNEENYVISLVRKPNGTHCEHAFLIIEGRDVNKSVIWFIDFRGAPKFSGIKPGKICIYKHSGELNDQLYGSAKNYELQKILAEERARQRQIEEEKIAYYNLIKQSAFLIGMLFLVTIAAFQYRNNKRKQKVNLVLVH